MQERTNLLRIHSIAEAYGKFPSEVIGMKTPWGAFQFNEVTLMVGRRAEKNVNEGKDAMNGIGVVNAVKRGYRSARQFVRKKIRIPESGVW